MYTKIPLKDGEHELRYYRTRGLIHFHIVKLSKVSWQPDKEIVREKIPDEHFDLLLDLAEKSMRFARQPRFNPKNRGKL